MSINSTATNWTTISRCKKTKTPYTNIQQHHFVPSGGVRPNLQLLLHLTDLMKPTSITVDRKVLTLIKYADHRTPLQTQWGGLADTQVHWLIIINYHLTPGQRSRTGPPPSWRNTGSWERLIWLTLWWAKWNRESSWWERKGVRHVLQSNTVVNRILQNFSWEICARDKNGQHQCNCKSPELFLLELIDVFVFLHGPHYWWRNYKNNTSGNICGLRFAYKVKRNVTLKQKTCLSI